METYDSSSWNHVFVIGLLLSSTAIVLFLALGRGGGSDPVASPSDLTSFSSLQRKAKERATRGVEEELARARRAIRRAATSAAGSSQGNATGNVFHGEHVPLAGIYRNSVAFFQSYVEMEKRFKVYVHEEGEPPLVHEGPCKDIYTTEGRFIEELEQQQVGGGARTRDPASAHAFFLPFSVVQMVRYVYEPQSWDHAPFKHFVVDYLQVIASKHPFWNRTAEADHFMLSCHDWALGVTSGL